MTTNNYSIHMLIPTYLLAHFFSTPRWSAALMGLDNNCNPRPMIAAQKAAGKSKITPQQIAFLERASAAHENLIGHFPLVVAATILGNMAHLPAQRLNTLGFGYFAVRLAYMFAYRYIERGLASYGRSVLWWTSNILCLSIIYQSGRKLQQ
ncbi:uncharacterized protein L969DRAFT_91877 [Mixia osmundae IAM 14324]|uniref:Uncharacterized protein n=1 Tax=Mixia osmundae (strain CBS 9802 / IAM 14324 / JCM 22182 / KY 12970) TaxID=764103 RepID=G7E394_MIXOS|nr:uncharacterized protein L969DRAFT_91877 [Mixia osmundae IAM 14324]KEI42436.1 hypothetical protein L969DRAFT_91877 [Mixia osmundae IAM 14324]GAA97275.1 hypothetical protein E5Q_03952 [Mixia osmundae IAM 14324]